MVKNKLYFDPVDLKINFPEKEKELLNSWNKNGTVDKYLYKNDKSEKYFSFLDGPITANNPMGVHHAWGRTYKDIWQRFKNMQGFKQRFQNGFDCQGLWVEVEVEKELGFKTKKDIEEYGIANFVEKCKERVIKYSGIQTEQSKRLGYFVDWEHSYYTMSDDNNYMIWQFLKTCFENGWIYKGNESIPWCPRCETAISQHEMLTEDYKEVTHKSIYFALPVIGRKNEYLLVWTTTPWTLPANIAVAVDRDFDYVLVEGGSGRNYWVVKSKENLVSDNPKVIREVKGKELEGLKYEGLFDNLSKVKKTASENTDKFHTVIVTDPLLMPITTTDGTGLVHTAVSAGTEDFLLGKKLGLPMIPVIKDNADYMDDMDFLSGLNAKKHPEVVLDYLQQETDKGNPWVFKIENITHRYPACWRCKTELVWKVADEWYISMDKPSRMKNDQFSISNEKKNKKSQSSKHQPPATNMTLRERMIGIAKKIKWIPEFGLERELDWLTNMHDWLISKKNRYWGLALPIYDCPKCGNFEVIGSKEELKNRSAEGWDKFEGHTPHRPFIDEVKITCSKCGEKISRILDVGNPWLDAGIVPYSTITKDNKSKPLYWEDKDEWKKWFPADFITESFPGQFKNWFYSMIAMSAVLENENPYNTVLGYATLLAEDGKPMHKSWGNAISFDEGADKIGVDVMRWMYVKQNPSENLLFGYKTADETRRRFHLTLWNIYNFFVTYANIDNWHPEKVSSKSGDKTAKSNRKPSSLLDRWILARLNELSQVVTLALEKFDAFTAASSIENFVNDFSLWYIRRSRERVGPAGENKEDKSNFYATAYAVLIKTAKLLAPFNPFISDLIYCNLTKEISVHLSDWEDGEKLDSEDTKLLEEMKLVRESVEKGHSTRKELKIAVKQPLKEIVITSSTIINPGLKQLIKDELNVKEVKWEVNKKSELKVKLDTQITPELEEEAKVRELIRSIQEKRKTMGLSLTQKVDVFNDWLPQNKELTQWLVKKAQIRNIDKGGFQVTKV